MDIKEFEYRLYMIRKQLVLLGLLLAFVAAVYLISKRDTLLLPVAEKSTPTLADAIREGTAPIPEFSSTTQAKLKASWGFQHLVSYTDGGFEPNTVTVKKGETIRFTNNSSNDVWIAADGSNVQIYPRTKSVCGSSDLDSCEPFEPQDFWEFTFDASGEWHVVNNLDKAKGGVVIVE